MLRDIAYTRTELPEHRLDIYRNTRRPGPYPVVLYVHGGGFRILSKDSHWLMGLIFARRGYLVFNISYRLAPRHPFPHAVEDTCAAYEWVVQNAAQYGGDVSRLVLAGESAGANLVTALAVALSYRRKEAFAERVWSLGVSPKAVLPACGVLQVSDPQRFLRNDSRLSRFVYDRISEVSDAYIGPGAANEDGALDLADPLVMLERGIAPDRPLPPFFALAGTRDPLLDDTRRLKVALDRLGVDCEARFYEGEMHAFHAFIWRQAAHTAWREMFAFLEPRVGT